MSETIYRRNISITGATICPRNVSAHLKSPPQPECLEKRNDFLATEVVPIFRNSPVILFHKYFYPSLQPAVHLSILWICGAECCVPSPIHLNCVYANSAVDTLREGFPQWAVRCAAPAGAGFLEGSPGGVPAAAHRLHVC